MRVSIVVDNFNYERFLAEAIDSALAQTHDDVEVVVVDDGSTDDSRDVIARYEGRVRAILQENRGQAGAFNTGFAAATGDVVLFLDADDVLLPEAAATAACHARDPEVSQVHWQLVDVDADGRPTGALTPPHPVADGDLLEHLLSEGPLQWTSPPTSGNAWPRRYLEQVMPMPEDPFRLSADAYLMALAPAHGTLRRVASPLSHYRRHGANNYGSEFDTIVRTNRELTRALLPIAAEHVVSRGLDVDLERWEARNYDFNLAGSLEDLEAVVGPAPFVLIDDQQLGLESTAVRRPIPFLERDGVYWGAPQDDREAIAELERLRAQQGARFLVLAWPSFWWTDTYPAFFEHVRGTYPCRLENDRLVVFDLGAATA